MEFKIPFYNVINILFIGLVFSGLCIFLFPEIGDYVFSILGRINNQVFDIVVVLTLGYEIGLILNWVASLVVEPILVNKKPLNKRGWFSRIFQISWKSYAEYQKAENDKLNMLPREMNVGRDHMTLFCVILIIAAITCRWNIVFGALPMIILFYCAYKKHAKKIVARIENALR